MTVALKDGLITLIPTLRAFAVSLCGDPVRADDLVQETLVKAWAHQASFQNGSNLRAWLFTILRNSYTRTAGSADAKSKTPTAVGLPSLPSLPDNRVLST